MTGQLGKAWATLRQGSGSGEQVDGATLTSLRCLAAGKRGTTAAIISSSWYSPGSGATPRI